MKSSRVPANMYKKYFFILLFVFFCMLVLEFAACMLGNPISTITINEEVIVPDTLPECLLYSAVAASLIAGVVNVFLTIRVVKEALGLTHWPAALVVIMTLLFPLELIIGALFVIPNIIIFGLKGRVKKQIYEVDF